MTLQAGSYNAYGAATVATGTPRAIEYQVFSQVTGELNRALQEGKSFADLAVRDNALPDALRGQLLSLAAFTKNHTTRVLEREAEAGVLVEINTAVMRGLRGQAPDAGVS